MTHRTYQMVERTLWIATCDCGERYEWADNPPKERRCTCGKWVTPKATTFTSPEYGARGLVK